MKTAKIMTVIGRVQGVGYRYYTQKQANRIGVYGYVKNLYNGNVEVYAIGTPQQLQNFYSVLLKGPSMSHVENILISEASINQNDKTFRITH
ncbi:MAG: acylphosphatase [Spirochaetes bacterium]|nr:acylphosphatase [Spirochaetota bacterium]